MKGLAESGNYCFQLCGNPTPTLSSEGLLLRRAEQRLLGKRWPLSAAPLLPL